MGLTNRQKAERRARGLAMLRDGATPAEAADRLGTATETVRMWARRAGVNPGRRRDPAEVEWSPEMDGWLRANPDKVTLAMCRKYLGCTPAAARLRAAALGLSLADPDGEPARLPPAERTPAVDALAALLASRGSTPVGEAAGTVGASWLDVAALRDAHPWFESDGPRRVALTFRGRLEWAGVPDEPEERATSARARNGKLRFRPARKLSGAA